MSLCYVNKNNLLKFKKLLKIKYIIKLCLYIKLWLNIYKLVYIYKLCIYINFVYIHVCSHLTELKQFGRSRSWSRALSLLLPRRLRPEGFSSWPCFNRMVSLTFNQAKMSSHLYNLITQLELPVPTFLLLPII